MLSHYLNQWWLISACYIRPQWVHTSPSLSRTQTHSVLTKCIFVLCLVVKCPHWHTCIEITTQTDHKKVCLTMYANISPIYYLPVIVSLEFGLLSSDVIWRHKLGKRRSSVIWEHHAITLTNVDFANRKELTCAVSELEWHIVALTHWNEQDGRLCLTWYTWMRTVFRFIFLLVCSWESNWWYDSIGSDNGLMTIRWQAFTWTNDDSVHRHHGHHARMNWAFYCRIWYL